VKTTRFKVEAKKVKKESLSGEEYRMRMREMMKKYTDAQVLEDLKTMPIATYFKMFGRSFDEHYGVQKLPSEY